jgi:predicted TIM-barrel fold metal-dependent hydrolase
MAPVKPRDGSRPALKFIDAHHHLWDLQALNYPWLMAQDEPRFFGDPGPIQKDYLAKDFLAESARYRPRQSVHVQVGVAPGSALAETQWLQQQPAIPNAIVAYADLSSTDLPSVLEAQRLSDRMRGIRQIIGRHPVEDLQHRSDELLDNRRWQVGLQTLAAMNLSFDLQLIPPQMARAFAVLKQVPQLKVALCHCGSPWDQSERGIQQWREGLRRFAQLPNFYCKVSGLGMFNPSWSVAQLRPLILDVIDIFGPQRVMFGSNFPVDKLYCSYEALWRAYEEVTQVFSAGEKRQLYYATAKSFYRI